MRIDDQPFVSVLTPVYNGAKFLRECIESVLSQTYSHWEYIIINNCSEDNTLNIAREYANKDSRIRVHNNDNFLGVIENHNLAFSLMSPEAKYCKVVSADDFIFPECISRMVELAEANPTVGLVGVYLLAGKKVLCDGLEYDQKVVDGRAISRATLLGGPYVFGSPTSLLYRSDLIRAKQAFYPHSNPHADTTACYEALETWDFGLVHQVLAYARIHADSQTSKSLKTGTYKLALLGDLVRFGRKYLSPTELEQRVEYYSTSYYRGVVHVLLERSGRGEFLQQQKTALQEISLRFSFANLMKTAVRMLIEASLKPGASIRRLAAAKRNAGKIEARYY